MAKRLLGCATLPLLLSVLLCPGSAAATVKPRIAIVGIAAEKLAPDVREKVNAAVAGGLSASGAEVVDSGGAAKGMVANGAEGCETPTCLTGIAQSAGARYLVRGAVEIDGRSYAIRLEMIDGTTGGVIEIREDRCEICTESEMYETAGVTASALKAAVSKRRAGAASTDEGARALLPPTAVAPASADGASPSSAPASSLSATLAEPSSAREAERSSGRKLPWVGIGAGAVGLGVGIYLLAIDGDGTCSHAPGDRCQFTYQTKAGGITLMSAGLLAVAAGAAVLIGHF